MTVIDLDEIFETKGVTKAPGDFARDSRGTPHISDPSGATVKSGPRKGEPKWLRYGRPSSFGKDIENSFGLQRWRERKIVHGIASAMVSDSAPDLVDVLIDLGKLEFNEAKDALDGLIVEAKRWAKASIAADQGTHVHELTEDIDVEERDPIARIERGEEHDLSPEVQHALLEAWRLGCEQYGLVMLEVERKVVHDEWRQAGTLDRLVMLSQDITFANGVTLPAGTVLLLDIKTGKITLAANSTVEYWHSYAVQCAVYAASVPYNVEDDTRGEWAHEIDQRWAIIAHLPVKEALAGKATLRLVLCDIAAGREAIETIVTPMKAWGARRDLFHFTADHEPVIEVAVPGVEERDDGQLYRMWLTTRLAQVAQHELAKVRMVTLWPEGVPGLKSGHQHTDDELALIEAVLTKVEASHSLPFVYDPRMGEPIAEEPKPEPVRWVAPDEGETLGMDHEDVLGLRRRIERLEPVEQSIAEQWMRETVDAGRGFSIKQCPSRRRWLIYRVALDFATRMEGESDMVRATLALVLPEAEQLAVTIGCALGSLTIDEARQLLELIPILARKGELTFDGDAPRWSAVPAA